MEDLKQILQDHDKDIFTDELCEKILEIVNKAKDAEIQTLTEEFEADNKVWREEQSALYEEKYNDLVEKLDVIIEGVTEEIHESQLENYQDKELVNEALMMHSIQKGMLEKYMIDFNKIDITADPSTHEENAMEITNLKKGLNEKEDELFNLKRKYNEVCRVSIVSELSEGLSELEKESLEDLCESLEYDADAPEEFIEKVGELRDKLIAINTNESETSENYAIDIASNLNENEEEEDSKTKMMRKSLSLM